ncbi:MAG: ABC transporter substrate-binding protein [Fusobacteriaceae bacterium]
MKKEINLKSTIKEIITKFPDLIDIFISKGFSGLRNSSDLDTLGKISLEMALNMKKIDVNLFKKILEDRINEDLENVDLTLVEPKQIEGALTLTGLLPCPVRIPLLEEFKKFLNKNPQLQINYELKAASSGLDWLKNDVIKANHPDKLSDMFISAGFDLFFDQELMGKFKKEGIFKDLSGIENYNTDFNNEKINLRDSSGDYSMIAVVPAIFLVNKEELGDREFPRTWKDILKPEFKKSVSLPIADFDLFNSILVHIYKEYGMEGVKSLGGALLENLHPSQMVKSDKNKINRPTITIMPYFFSKMIKADSPLVVQWPEDGAIISPIFMLTKKEKEKELKPLIDFMTSNEVGEILSHQGLFPSILPTVINPTKGKKFMWVGWEFIYNNNIGKLIKECEKVFFENSK